MFGFRAPYFCVVLHNQSQTTQPTTTEGPCQGAPLSDPVLVRSHVFQASSFKLSSSHSFTHRTPIGLQSLGLPLNRTARVCVVWKCHAMCPEERDACAAFYSKSSGSAFASPCSPHKPITEKLRVSPSLPRSTDFWRTAKHNRWGLSASLPSSQTFGPHCLESGSRPKVPRNVDTALPLWKQHKTEPMNPNALRRHVN